MIDNAASAPPSDGRVPDGIDARLIAVLRSFVRSSVGFGRRPGDQFERVAQALCRRIVTRSLEDPRPVRDVRELQAALTEKSSLPFDGSGAAVVSKAVLSRVGPLKLLARRTPWLMAASVVPDVYSALVRGRDEVAIVSSFLVHRARGGDIDPDRLRRVTVQLLQRRRLDPDSEPGDADLVSSWIRRAVRSALPFVKAGATPHAKSIVAAASSVDPAMLHRR
jgi:hypothetical protein